MSGHGHDHGSDSDMSTLRPGLHGDHQQLRLSETHPVTPTPTWSCKRRHLGVTSGPAESSRRSLLPQWRFLNLNISKKRGSFHETRGGVGERNNEGRTHGHTTFKPTSDLSQTSTGRPCFVTQDVITAPHLGEVHIVTHLEEESKRKRRKMSGAGRRMTSAGQPAKGYTRPVSF